MRNIHETKTKKLKVLFNTSIIIYKEDILLNVFLIFSMNILSLRLTYTYQASTYRFLNILYAL